MKNKLINQEKGSIAVYAIATVLSFTFILGGIFFTSAVIRKNQLRTMIKIKEIYAQDIGRADEISDALGISAKDIADSNNKSAYYGKTVNYKTSNATVASALKGQKTLYSEGVTWQLFYADEENIYLIASDYVPLDTLPQPIGEDVTTEGTAPANTNSSYPLAAPLTNVLSDYSTGSARITNEKLQVLNSSYYEYLTNNHKISTNANMQAVAYLMDTEAWSSFMGNGAEYVIGGPTVEMLMKSYSENYNLKNEEGKYKYQAKVTNSLNGYQISYDYGTSWHDYIEGSDSYLDALADNMYVKTINTSRANAYWLASPSARDATYAVGVLYNGRINGYKYNSSGLGFRPLVCLSNSVRLKPVYNAKGEILSFNIK